MHIEKHADQVFTVSGFISTDECRSLIALAEHEGFASAGVRLASGQVAMPKIRNNERTILDSAEWVGLLWTRLQSIQLPRLDGHIAAGLPKELRFYKYLPGQRFKMHKDGPWTENGLTSKLTFLIYLNEEFSGGETGFKTFKIKPEAGDALLFVHDTWHEGAEVTEGVKYVLRSDILYAPESEAHTIAD